MLRGKISAHMSRLKLYHQTKLTIEKDFSSISNAFRAEPKQGGWEKKIEIKKNQQYKPASQPASQPTIFTFN